jgi:hypothetical protein
MAVSFASAGCAAAGTFGRPLVLHLARRRSPSQAKKIVRRLTDYRGNKTHVRHIHFDELKDMGLKVSLIEDDQNLQDVVLTVHHCFMHSLMNTAAFKMIENHKGSALVKQQIVQQVVMQPAPRN